MSWLELRASIDPMPFKEPLRIAGRVIEGIPAVRVTLGDGEHIGRGEAGGVFYLNDDADQMIADIERVRADVERGISRENLRELMRPCGARNALDAALWELESLRSGIPVWQLANLPPPRPLVTSFTIGADPPERVEIVLEGYRSARRLKIKLEGSLDADVERVRFVRARRPDAWIMVDANQGYDRPGLERLIPLLEAEAVSIIEQPCRRGSEEILDGLGSLIAFAADESLLALSDLPKLAGRFQVANIKLDKCGGLTEALLLQVEARRMGMQVMVGNMGGSSLAAAPAFLLGQLCDHVDLDGPAFVRKDLPKHVTFENGLIHSPDDLWGSDIGGQQERH